jgi:PAS domain S-box-containing protein
VQACTSVPTRSPVVVGHCFVCFQLGLNLAPVGFAYVLLIAALSLLGGFGASLVLSIAAVACLNYFFAPPLFDLRVDAPQDVLAIAAFATTSLIVTALTTKLRNSADTQQQAVRSLRRARDEIDAKVTARKQAEEALRKSEEESRELFEHHPAMYFLIEPGGAVLSVNAFGAAQLGYSVTELAGRSVFDVFDEEDREYVKSKIGTCLQNIGQPFSWEVRKCRKDGSMIWVREHAKAVQRAEGFLVLVVCEDITERRRSEDALRQSEMLLAEAQRISRTGSFALRAVTREAIWSTEMFRIFGWDRTTKPTLELLLERAHPEDRASVGSLLQNAWKEGKGWEHKHRLLMPDGSVKHLHAAGHPVRNPAGELEFFGAVMDITDTVQAEEELYRLRTELAHVNRVMTLGELTASIAHEVNQPLTAVVTDASAASRWLDGQSPDLAETRQALARIQKNGNRAADVIRHIRALAKKTPIQMSQVDINEVILSVIAVARNEIERSRIALRTKLGADLPAIRADRVHLQQVVLNLVMNAIEAMADCEPRDLLVSSGQKAPYKLVVSVFDSGAGLNPQNVNRLFEPFYTTKNGGMGMGLAICRSILETHGGRLLARANEPRGAIFEFELPIEQAEAASAADLKFLQQ